MLSSDFSGAEKPLVAGFMRGYRAWRPAPNPSARFPVRDVEKLRSSNAFYVWQKGRNVAHCTNISYVADDLAQWSRISENRCFCAGCGSYEVQLASAQAHLERLRGHHIPSDGPDCRTCGFYALHNLRQFHEATAMRMYIDATATVYGSIKATGTVIIGTKGFRAQYAEVEALAGPDAGPYAEYYGVPWFPEGLQSLVESFPATTVERIDEPVAVEDSSHYSYFTLINRVTIPGSSPPITALVPNPDPAESNYNGPLPGLDAPAAPMGPVPMDPEPENRFTKWINTLVWRRG